MITLQGKSLRLNKTHKKNNSTDSLNSERKRRFLTVVSATINQETTRPHPVIKTVAQLKKQAMGHRTTKSTSEQLSNEPFTSAFTQLDQNSQTLKIYPSMQKQTKLQSKSLLLQPNDLRADLNSSQQTPIKKLLFQSTCKQNWQ